MFCVFLYNANKKPQDVSDPLRERWNAISYLVVVRVKKKLSWNDKKNREAVNKNKSGSLLVKGSKMVNSLAEIHQIDLFFKSGESGSPWMPVACTQPRLEFGLASFETGL